MDRADERRVRRETATALLVGQLLGVLIVLVIVLCYNAWLA